MTTREAQLNLRLTAQDQASAVFRSLVAEVRSSFETIRALMNESFNVNGLKNVGAEIAGNLESNFQKAVRNIDAEVTQAAEAASNALVPIGETSVSVARNMESAFRDAANVIDVEFTATSESIGRSFQQAAASARETISQIEKEASGIGKSFFDKAQLMLAGQQLQMAGQQILHFFASAAKSAIDFDQDIHNVVANLDAMGDHTMKPEQAFEALKQKALELGMTGFFSANQIAQAMSTMASQGITAQQILNGAIDTVANVAAANQQDLEHTANVITDIIHQMGGELKTEFGDNFKAQMEGVGNAVTKALHNGRMSMDDFLAVMRYAGPQAADLNVKFKDLAGAIAELARHGIKGSQAGTTLRRMFTNLIPQTKAAETEMRNLGFITKDGANIFLDSSGKMLPLVKVQEMLHDRISKLPPAMQEMAVKTIFGQYALSGMMAIVDESPAKFKALVDSMGDTKAMSEALAEKEKGLGFMVQQLQAHFDTFKKEVGDYLKPVLIGLISAAEGLFKVWQAIPGPIKETIVIFGAVAATLATAVGGFLVFITTLDMLPAALGPWGLLVSGIITGVALIVSHWQSIEKWVNNIFGINLPAVFKSFQKAFSEAWNGVTKAFDDVWKQIQKIFDASWKKIQPDIIAGVKEVRKWWGDEWKTIQKTFSDVWNYVKKVFGETWKKIEPDIIAGAKEVAKFWNQEWPTIKKTFEEVWNAIKKVFDSTLKKMEPELISGIKAMQKSWDQTWPMIKKVFSDAWNIMKKVFDDVWKKLIPDIINGIKEAQKYWDQTWPIIKKTFSDTWNAISKLFQDVWQKVGPAIIAGVKEVAKWWNQEWPTIQKLFEQVWNSIWKTFQEVWKYIGPQIISGLKEVQQYWDKVWPEIQQVFSIAWSIIKFILSTSLHFILQNWTEIWNMIKDDFKAVWDSMIGELKLDWDIISGLFKIALDLLTLHWGRAWHDMWGMLRNVIHDIEDTIGKLTADSYDWGKNLVKMLANGILDAAQWVEHAALYIAQKITDILGFHSPTKEGPAHDSDKWMPNMINMFTDTLEESRPAFQKELFKVAMDVNANLNPTAPSQPLKNIGQLFTVDPYANAYDRIAGHSQHNPTTSLNAHVKGDPYANAYDRLPGHSAHHPTTSLYDRVAAQSARPIELHFHIEGRSKETDRQLVKQMVDELGRRFRTHIPMHVG